MFILKVMNSAYHCTLQWCIYYMAVWDANHCNHSVNSPPQCNLSHQIFTVQLYTKLKNFVVANIAVEGIKDVVGETVLYEWQA